MIVFTLLPEDNCLTWVMEKVMEFWQVICERPWSSFQVELEFRNISFEEGGQGENWSQQRQILRERQEQTTTWTHMTLGWNQTWATLTPHSHYCVRAAQPVLILCCFLTTCYFLCQVTNPSAPFSIGVTLENLSAQVSVLWFVHGGKNVWKFS